jgi:predicted GIY-YIG superfamily endonuclease
MIYILTNAHYNVLYTGVTNDIHEKFMICLSIFILGVFRTKHEKR